MGWNRWARPTKDLSEGPIKEALKKAGYLVDDDPLVDLQVRHPSWIPNVFVKLEVKTPKKDGQRVIRKDRHAQDAYCHAHGIPYILTPESALSYLRERGKHLIDVSR